MQFLTNLFSGTANTLATTVLALIFVLALIVFGLWIAKFVFRTTTGLTHGRGRRLTVVERLPVDGRRSLLLVRRDNVEHLIITGGQQDVVVETGIPSEHKPPVPLHRPVTPGAAAERTIPPGREKTIPPTAREKTIPPAREKTMHPGVREKTSPPVLASAAPPPRPTVLSSHADPLRDALKQAVERKGPSLRHTALLRPVSVMEPAVMPMPPVPGDNSVRGQVDSGTNAHDENGRARVATGGTLAGSDEAGLH